MRWIALFLALVAGCNSGQTLRDGICFKDDPPDCGGPCPTYSAAAADLRAAPCHARYHAEIGTCGAYSYTFFSMNNLSMGTSSTAMYFDASGAIVVLVTGGDLSINCGGQTAKTLHYGPELDCVNHATEVICTGL